MPQPNAGAASAATDAQRPANNNANAEADAQNDGGAQRENGDSAERPTSNVQRPTSNSEEESGDITPSVEDLAQHLNLPPGVREELAKQSKRSTSNAQRPTSNSEGEDQDGKQGPAANADAEAEEQSSEEEGEIVSEQDQDHEQEEEEGDGEPLPKDVRKLQKRVARLTKKLRDRERALEAIEAERAGGDAGGRNGQQRQQVPAGPRSGGILGGVRSEQQLDQMVSEAESLIDLVAANPDGWTEGEGDKAVFHPPEELKAWDREAQKIARGAEGRRRQLREFQSQRSTFDNAARTEWPELFKTDSKEYQAGVRLVQEMPFLAEHPGGNFAIGIMLEGYKARNARLQAKGGGENRESRIENRDLDPRLDPEHQRTHIPPTTKRPAPNPPGRANGANGARAKVEAAVERVEANPNDRAARLALIGEHLEAKDNGSGSRKPVLV